MNGLKRREQYLNGVDFLSDFIDKKQEANEKVSTHAIYLWNELEKLGLSPEDRVQALISAFRARDHR
jgi:hypothetical protein